MGHDIMTCILILLLTIPRIPLINLFVAVNHYESERSKNQIDFTEDIEIFTPMEALDLVQSIYAINFQKISLQENLGDYYYKLDTADYYLVYEGREDVTGYYLIHLYEFVLDELDTGIGHTVTYGWYRVDPYSGKIEPYP